MSYSQDVLFGGLALLFFFSAILFALSSQAFSSLKSSDIKWLKRKNDRSSTTILKMLSMPNELILALEIGKIFSLLGLVYSGNLALIHLFNAWINGALVFYLNIGVLILFIILFVFLVPKIYANNHALIISKFTSSWVKIFFNLAKPLTNWWINTDKSIVSSFFKKTQTTIQLSKEDLLYKRILSFDKKNVKQILIPRNDINAIHIIDSFEKIKAIITQNAHSRLPVFQDNIDNIVGILFAKDLIPYLDYSDYYWNSLVKDVLYIPQQMSLAELLRKFQTKRNHMAVVVDEFGGTIGIVTLEDVIEEITGDIMDEFDNEIEFIETINNSTFKIDSHITMHDLNRFLEPFNFQLEQLPNIESLNGFLIEKFEKIPNVGDIIDLGKVRIEILNVSVNKIDKVHLYLTF